MCVSETAGVDPTVLPPLCQEIRRVLVELPSILIPGVTPVVACHIDDTLNKLVEAELSPYLISLYVRRGTMPQGVADELAGSAAYIIRHM